MQTGLQTFTHPAFGNLDVWMDGDRPLFPAIEAAKVLGYTNPYDAITKHCAGKGVAFREVLSAGGPQQRKYITEGDLYRLIARSKLPTAQQFERWVFDEVLPAIRKHGMFATPATIEKIITDPDFLISLAHALKAERTKVAALTKEVEELAPAAAYCNSILQSKDPVTATAIAKDYGMSAFTFNKMLHDMGIQYRQNGMWLLYQPYANKGYTCSKTFDTGPETCRMHTYWTQRGRYFLYEFLRDEADLLPMIERTSA